ncbi:MAG TPA: M20/M25/M40 family metallo-hydrolase [Tepidisphaeraceae bacterium]|nr:M20/M25/M40 family metallo-hydrolase [Tepidisphaeraceae bacterium]
MLKRIPAVLAVFSLATFLHAVRADITADALMSHIRVLSSDDFEGRAPGTPGEEKTVNYLVSQFKAMGLSPGNPDGTYLQDVPLVGFTAQPAISFMAGSQKIDFKFPNDAVVWSRHFQPDVKVKDCPVVFVGYGVVAPEYGWDDFKDVDVRGKTLLMLINDPPVPDPNDPTKLDPKMFKGREMTYYGRWTYKYEIAAKKGARAAIIVHQTGPAGYPWGVVMISNGRENFGLQTPDATSGRVAVEGWITLDNARKILSAAGADFDALKKSAVSRDFRPVPLNLTASFDVRSTLRNVASRNVIAKVEGSDPSIKDQYVIYTAHWDHLGRDLKLKGDQIYNGAVDNASGTAALLELAREFAKNKPRRTILFLSVTAEEKGLLGSKYYAEHPLYPLNRTLADINIDTVNVWGKTRDIGVVGMGESTLEDILADAVKAQGRVLVQEAEPEKGHYFRSDHFEFARAGVPALYLDKGIDFIGKPIDFGRRKREEYVSRDYHQVTDEIKPDWDLSGAAQDTQLLFEVGKAVADGQTFPQWKPGSEFKARRDEMMRKVSG